MCNNFTLKNVKSNNLNIICFQKTFSLENKNELDDKIRLICKKIIKAPIHFDEIDKILFKYDLSKNNNRKICVNIVSTSGKKLKQILNLCNSSLTLNDKACLFNLKNQINLKQTELIPGLVKVNKEVENTKSVDSLIKYLILNPYKKNEEIFNKLLANDPLDIPLNDLLKIKITANNKKPLAHLWSVIFQKCYLNGNLAHLKKHLEDYKNIVQIDYAKKYLLAWKLCPVSLYNIQYLNEERLINVLSEQRATHKYQIASFLRLSSDYHPQYSDDSANYYVRQLRKNPNNLSIISKLTSISSLKIPLTELAQISLTSFNQAHLAKLWYKYIEDLFKHGKLLQFIENTSPSIYEQSSFAHKFIVAREMVPKKLIQLPINNNSSVTTLQSLFKSLDDKCSSEAIKNFLLCNSDLTDLEVNTNAKNLASIKKTYFLSIEPILQNSIKVFSDLSALEMLLILTNKNNSILNGFIELVKDKFKKKNCEKKVLLYFNDEKLKFILLKKLKKHFMSLPSLSYIQKKKAMNVLLKIENLDKKTSSKIKLSTKTQKSFQTKCTRLKSAIYLNDVLYNDKIINESLTNSKSDNGFTNHENSDLMLITRFINKYKNLKSNTIKNKKNKKDYSQFLEALKRIKKNKGLKTKISTYVKNSSAFRETIILILPKVLCKLVDYFFPKKIQVELTHGITKDAIEFVDNYFHTLKYEDNLNKIEKINNKLNLLLNKFNGNPGSISKEDKLTLSEIGILGRLKKRGQWLEQLDTILGDNKTKKNLFYHLEKLLQCYKKVTKNLEKLEKILMPNLNKTYHDGDIIVHSASKKQKWNGAPLDIVSRLTAVFSNGWIHAAKLFYKPEERKLFVTEIEFNFRQRNFDLHDLLISDVWRVNILSLIPPCTQQICKKVYGKKWKKKLNELYRNIENETQTKLEQAQPTITNSTEKRIFSGIYDVPVIGKYFLRNEIVKQKINNVKNNNILKNEQICSEFATRITVSTLSELNTKITNTIEKSRFKKWNAKNVMDVLTANGVIFSEEITKYLSEKNSYNPKLEKKIRLIFKKHGYSNEDIEAIFRLRNERVLDLPFSDTEDFSLVHPGKMIRLLRNKKCLERVNYSKNFQQLINVDS